MKLKFLVLRDIGPFRGRHIFDFSQESNSTGYAFFAKMDVVKHYLQRYEMGAIWLCP